LGNALGEFRIQSHTSNLLNLVWFSDLKFPNANAMEILGTSNSPHERSDFREDAMNVRALVLGGIFVSLTAPAFAHHSFAMFDREKAVNISGVVKEYEWTNPHVWIHVLVPDAQGTPREWSFEMQSVQQDAAAGWRADSVKPGDKVSVEYHPLKDGSRGGQLMSAILANGQRLGPPAAPQLAFPRPAATE
jgi:hypothetical protein